MNFQGIKATVPPRIFIQTEIRLGQKSQFNSKKLFLWELPSHGPAPWPSAQRTYHCLLSSFMAPALPAPAEPEPPDPAWKGVGRATGSSATTRWTTASG